MTAEEDRRAEWLEWRRKGLGASDIAAVLGVSPWASPYSVWVDKMGLLPDSPASAPMEYGKRAEQMIRQWFTDETGLHVTSDEIPIVNTEHSWMRATVDGAVLDIQCTAGGDCELPGHDDLNGIHSPSWRILPPTDLADATAGLEMKAEANKSPWAEIPAHYQGQGQWQMAVTGWERIYFAVLHGFNFKVYELERDEEDIQFMIERGEEFWHQYVLAGAEPPVDGHEATAAAFNAVYPDADPESSIDLRYMAETFRSLVAAKAAKKGAEAEVRKLSNEIKAAMADAYEATVGDSRVATLGSQTRKTTCKHCGASDESEPFRVLRERTKEIQNL